MDDVDSSYHFDAGYKVGNSDGYKEGWHDAIVQAIQEVDWFSDHSDEILFKLRRILEAK